MKVKLSPEEKAFYDAFQKGWVDGSQSTLSALRVVTDSMKSDSRTPTANIMNSILEEVYTKTVERLRQEEE